MAGAYKKFTGRRNAMGFARNPEELTMAGHVGQTREPRTSRLLTAQIMSPRLGTTKIVVRNISASGLGGKSEQILFKGEEVAVLLNNIGAIDATVIWTSGHCFGLQFHEKIDPAKALAPPTERVVKPYEVPTYFRPEISTYRPGFNRK